MPQIDPVILQLKADIADYQRKITAATSLVDRQLGQQGKAVERLESRMSRSTAAIGGGFRAIAAGLATGLTVRELSRLADSAKNIEAQLRLATRESGSFAQAQDDVRRIAMDARSGLDETAKLYGNFQRNARELGITQLQAAAATETVSKTFKISGASVVDATQGTRQLIQALQSGVLRGDEFNSVMESSPRLVRLLADSLDVPIGSLRAMAEAGELTSDKLVRAFTDTKFTKGIDAEFRGLPVTFDQALTQIENAAIITFGAFDRGGQFSTILATFALDGANGFADLEGAAERFGRTVSGELSGIVAIASGVIASIRAINSALESASNGQYSFLRGAQQIGAVADFLNPGKLLFKTLQLNPAYQNAKTQSIQSNQGAAREQKFRDSLGGLDLFSPPTGNPLKPSTRATRSAGGGSSKVKAGPSAETLANRAAQEAEKALRDEISFNQDYSRLQDDLIAAKNALKIAANDILNAQTQEIDIERIAKNERLEGDVRLKNLTREQADDLATLNDQIAAQLTAKVEQSRKELAEQVRAESVRDEIDTLGTERDIARNRKERLDIEQRILDLSYQEEKAQLDIAISKGEIADAAKANANLERRKAAAQSNLNNAASSPGQRYLSDLRDEAANLGDEYENIAVNGLDRASDSMAELVKNATGLHGILGDIVGDFIELAIRQAILRPLSESLFGGSSGGGGGIFSAIAGAASSVIGKTRASGGPVSAGQLYRVNEGAVGGRVEGFVPNGGGKVIPLGAMNNLASSGGSSVVQHFHLDARGAVMTQDIVNQINAMGQQAAIAGAKGGHALASRDLANIQRPRL